MSEAIKHLENELLLKDETIKKLVSELQELSKQNEELQQACKSLKQECEELKKETKILQNRNQQLDGAITKVKCYEQALDKISELANENKNTAQYRGICQSILNIINKVKENK